MKPLSFNTQAVVKIATEPLNPSELPKMVRHCGLALSKVDPCLTKAPRPLSRDRWRGCGNSARVTHCW